MASPVAARPAIKVWPALSIQAPKRWGLVAVGIHLAAALACSDGVEISCDRLELNLRVHYATTAAIGPTTQRLPGSRRLELFRFSLLDVWAPSREEAYGILASASRARRRERELLGELDWHLTVVAIDRLPRGENADLRDFARESQTLIIAWPTEKMMALSLAEAIYETADELDQDGIEERDRRTFWELGKSLARGVRDTMFEHEYGHLATIARHPTPTPDGETRYGTALPDWLEESIAMAFTPQPLGALARSIAAIRASPFSLVEFIKTRHPRTPEGAADTPPPWMRLKAVIRIDGKPESNEIENVAELYYPLSDVFAAFIVDIAGPGSVSELLEAALVSNRGETGWVDLAQGSRLPANVRELETAFETWLARQLPGS